MEKTAQKTPISVIIHSCITLALMFGVGFLPPFSTVTPMGMKVLGIFLGLIYGWTFVGFSWTSLLAILMLGWSGFGSVNSMLRAAFGDGQTVLLILVMTFAYFFVSTGMSTQFAQYLVSNRLCIGRPWVMSFFVLFTGWCLGSLTGGVASIIITWSFFYGMCKVFGYEPGEKYPTYMVLGIGFSCILGFGCMPFRPVPIILISSLEKLSGGAHTISYGEFALINVPLTLLVVLTYLMLMRFVFKPDVSKVLNVDPQYFIEMRRNIKLTFHQKVAAWSMAFFVVAAFIPSIMPKSILASFFKPLGTQGLLALLIVILVIWRKDGKPLMDFNRHVKEGCQWDVIIMIASTCPLAAALKSPKIGILDMMNKGLEPLFSGLDPVMFIVMLAVLCWVMTQFVHNAVVATVFMPILYSFCITNNVDPVGSTALLGFAASAAYLTPAASTPAAVIFGNTEWSNVKDAYRASILSSLIAVTFMVAIGVPMVGMLIGISM